MHQNRPLDEIDIALLDVLQEKARIKRNELAEMTNLSIPAVSERLKKLEDNGIISCYRAILDPRKLGKDVTAYIDVSVDSPKNYRVLLNHVRDTEEVIECHAVTGAGTHMLKVRATNTEELEKLLSKIQSWQGVQKTLTRVVLSSPKETTRISVKSKKGRG